MLLRRRRGRSGSQVEEPLEHLGHAVLVVGRRHVLGKRAQKDDYSLRQAAVANRVPYTTTLSGASAACDAIEGLIKTPATVMSLQEWQGMLK